MKIYREEMTSAAIPGTGQTPEGKPAGFGDPIVNPGSAARWKKINATHKGGILRRTKPNMVAEEGAYGNSGEGSFGYAPLIPSTREKFAGSAVFEVDSATFHTAKFHKSKGKHWRKYLGEDDCLSEIRDYANKHPGKPIIIKNKNTGEMCFARYGKGR